MQWIAIRQGKWTIKSLCYNTNTSHKQCWGKESRHIKRLQSFIHIKEAAAAIVTSDVRSQDKDYSGIDSDSKRVSIMWNTSGMLGKFCFCIRWWLHRRAFLCENLSLTFKLGVLFLEVSHSSVNIYTK